MKLDQAEKAFTLRVGYPLKDEDQYRHPMDSEIKKKRFRSKKKRS